MQLVLVPNLVTGKHHLQLFKIWPPDGATWVTCIATLPWIALLALSVSIELVSSSARVTSVKCNQRSLTQLERLGPIDRTPLNLAKRSTTIWTCTKSQKGGKNLTFARLMSVFFMKRLLSFARFFFTKMSLSEELGTLKNPWTMIVENPWTLIVINGHLITGCQLYFISSGSCER